MAKQSTLREPTTVLHTRVSVPSQSRPVFTAISKAGIQPVIPLPSPFLVPALAVALAVLGNTAVSEAKREREARRQGEEGSRRLI